LSFLKVIIRLRRSQVLSEYVYLFVLFSYINTHTELRHEHRLYTSKV